MSTIDNKSFCDALVTAYTYNKSCDKSLFSCFFTRKVVILDQESGECSVVAKNWFSSSYGKGLERVDNLPSLAGRFKTLPEFLSKEKNVKFAIALTYFGHGHLGGIAEGNTQFGGVIPSDSEQADMTKFLNPNNQPNIRLRFAFDGIYQTTTRFAATTPLESSDYIYRTDFFTYDEVRKGMCAKNLTPAEKSFQRAFLSPVRTTSLEEAQTEIRNKQETIERLFNPTKDPNITVSFHENEIHIDRNGEIRVLSYEEAKVAIQERQARIENYFHQNPTECTQVRFLPNGVEVSCRSREPRTYGYKDVEGFIETREEREAIKKLLNPTKDKNIEILIVKDEVIVKKYDHQNGLFLGSTTYSYADVRKGLRYDATPNPLSVYKAPLIDRKAEAMKFQEQAEAFFNPRQDENIEVYVHDNGISVEGRELPHRPLNRREENYSDRQVLTMMESAPRIRTFLNPNDDPNIDVFFSSEVEDTREWDHNTGREERVLVDVHYVHVRRPSVGNTLLRTTDSYTFEQIDELMALEPSIQGLLNPEDNPAIDITLSSQGAVVCYFEFGFLKTVALYPYKSITKTLNERTPLYSATVHGNTKLNELTAQKTAINRLFNPENSHDVVITYEQDGVRVKTYESDFLKENALYTYQSIQEALAEQSFPEAVTDRDSTLSSASTVDWSKPHDSPGPYTLLEMEELDDSFN